MLDHTDVAPIDSPVLDVDDASAQAIELAGLFALKILQPFLLQSHELGFSLHKDIGDALVDGTKLALSGFYRNLVQDDDVAPQVRLAALRQSIKLGVVGNYARQAFEQSGVREECAATNKEIRDEFDRKYEKPKGRDADFYQELMRGHHRDASHKLLPRALLDDEKFKKMVSLMVEKTVANTQELVNHARMEMSPSAHIDVTLSSPVLVAKLSERRDQQSEAGLRAESVRSSRIDD